MNLHVRHTLAATVWAVTSMACSPALNWREVPLQGMVTLLPCKPDHAERKLQLGPSDVTLHMSGCEAAGALYAISHVRVADTQHVQGTYHAWRLATLAAMQATSVAMPPAQQPVTPSPLQTKAPRNPEKMDGKRPDGSAVQAQLLWLHNGADLYHVAVYGSKLQPEMTELLFSELKPH